MSNAERANGFELAEALEPAPRRGDRIADIVRIAEFLGPPASASPAEIERSARAVSVAAGHDGELLSEACHEALRLVSEGRCARGVVSLLSEARRELPVTVAAGGPRIVIAPDHGRLVLKVSGVLTGELGDQLVETVEAALAVAPAVALDLRAVREWTAEGLEGVSLCAERGVVFEAS